MIGIALMGAGRMIRTHAKAIGAAGGKLVTVYDVASLPLPLAGLGHIALTRPHPTLLLQSFAGVSGDQADSADQALPADRTLDIAPSLPCYVLATRVLVVSVLAAFLQIRSDRGRLYLLD